jgi:glyceraldehyde 3-phosphate dehydrogenase
MKNIGVNGFGRIGRYFTRLSLTKDDISVKVVNDLGDINTLMHLLKYDSVHGKLNLSFKITGNKVTFENGKEILFLNEPNPENVHWNQYNVETVIEATGLFLTKEKAYKHITGGAKKVILSAPAKDSEIKTVVLGVNEEILEENFEIISNASCTTNSAAPLIKVISELYNIENAFISTVHSYTSDQNLQDAPHRDLRRGRAAANSIIPTTTGAAKALIKIFPELNGKIEGSAFRIPVPNGSITDLTIVTKGKTPSVSEINDAFKKAAEGKLKNILSYTDEPLVSSDIIGNPSSSLYDSLLTSVTGNMIKIYGWYDNEAGYSNRLIDLIRKI